MGFFSKRTPCCEHNPGTAHKAALQSNIVMNLMYENYTEYYVSHYSKGTANPFLYSPNVFGYLAFIKEASGSLIYNSLICHVTDH